MRVWLIGAGSLLGPAIAKQLNAVGIPFFGTTRADVDVTSEEHVKRILDGSELTHIINCAAFTDVDGSESQHALAMQLNADVPELLGRLAAEQDIHLIHFSTDYVFDGNTDRPWKEAQCTAPINFYGRSKLEGEQRVRRVTSKYCIIRTSSLFGGMGKHFVTAMLDLMQKRTHIDVVSDQYSRPTYRQDLAKAAVRMLDATGIYHFANAGPATWLQFAERIHDAALNADIPLTLETIRPISSKDFPRAAQRPAYSALNTDRCDGLLGPSRPWQDALEEYIERNRDSFLDLTTQSSSL